MRSTFALPFAAAVVNRTTGHDAVDGMQERLIDALAQRSPSRMQVRLVRCMMRTHGCNHPPYR